jgi:hypothetical protein
LTFLVGTASGFNLCTRSGPEDWLRDSGVISDGSIYCHWQMGAHAWWLMTTSTRSSLQQSCVAFWLSFGPFFHPSKTMTHHSFILCLALVSTVGRVTGCGFCLVWFSYDFCLVWFSYEYHTFNMRIHYPTNAPTSLSRKRSWRVGLWWFQHLFINVRLKIRVWLLLIETERNRIGIIGSTGKYCQHWLSYCFLRKPMLTKYCQYCQYTANN